MIYFTVPGKPQAKQRARVGKWGGYTPKATANAEAAIQAEAKRANVRPMAGPLKMRCDFIFAPPASWSKRKRADAMGTYKANGSDVDNMVKTVCDALNNHAYEDDKQVVTISARKVYGQRDETIIHIEQAPERAPL